MRILLCLPLLALLTIACVRVSSDQDGSKVDISAPGVSISVTQDGDGGKVSVRAPGAVVEVGTEGLVSETDLGVPFYPGAVQTGATAARNDDQVDIEVAFTTEDPSSDVERFYDKKLSTSQGWRQRKRLTTEMAEAVYLKPENGLLRRVFVSNESGSTVIRISYGPDD